MYRKIRKGLAAASAAIIASPVRLPPKVVVVAKCVALALGVLEAVDGANRDAADGDMEGRSDENE